MALGTLFSHTVDCLNECAESKRDWDTEWLCLLRACMISSANSDLSLFPLHITTIRTTLGEDLVPYGLFLFEQDYVQGIQLWVS